MHDLKRIKRRERVSHEIEPSRQQVRQREHSATTKPSFMRCRSLALPKRPATDRFSEPISSLGRALVQRLLLDPGGSHRRLTQRRYNARAPFFRTQFCKFFYKPRGV